MTPNPVLTLTAPGTAFHESFLMGNGWMGQAIHGQTAREVLELSHIAFYSGCPDEDAADPAAPEAHRLAREAAARGDWAEAEKHIASFMGKKEQYGTSLPVGTLTIDQALGPCLDYRRTLDMGTGVMRMSFTHDGHMQTRECFCSHPDLAFFLRVTDDAPMKARIALGEGRAAGRAEDGGLWLEAWARETRHSGGKCGTHLLGRVEVDPGDGEAVCDGGALEIRGSRAWMLRMTMETDFILEEDAPRPSDGAWAASARKRLRGRCSLADYDGLLARHIADFSARMNAAGVCLSGDDSAAFAQTMFAF